MLFMRPEDQASLRDCMRRRDFLTVFLESAPRSKDEPWFATNARKFIAVCEAHGRTAAQHHDSLVARFIEKPSSALDAAKLAQVTASGPPLGVLMKALETLRDLRLAAPRQDIPSRHEDLQRLKSLVSA
jgi:hypothetical protein